MNKEEFNSKINDIRNKVKDLPELVEVSDLLTDLFTGSNELFDELETTAKTQDELKLANDKLREVNNKLFLKIGDHEDKQDDIPTPPTDEKEPEEKKSFKDLFNEKGEFK